MLIVAFILEDFNVNLDTCTGVAALSVGVVCFDFRQRLIYFKDTLSTSLVPPFAVRTCSL